ncbi:MAG: phage portal protein, partial [Candidatus Micrarchaeota archaeon]
QGAVLNKPYEQSVWVYSAVNAIATNISRVPFVIRRDIGAGLSKKIEEGPIYDLFLNPNPLMSQRQLFEATMIFLSLQGEAIWILEGRENITQIPKEIWTFSPARFKPVQNKQGQVVGWNYDNGTTELIPLANHEIIFFRYFNPYDDIRGLPPIKAAQESINQDYYATKYNTAFFKNSASISGFISVEGELTDEQFNRTLKQFEDRHQGYEKAHKIALLEGGGKFTPSTITQKDMDYILGKNMTKQEILASLKVNEVVLGNFDSVKCFHPDTEVFTDKGFFSVKDIKVGDKVASMDPITRKASFKLANKTYVYDYEGILYKQTGKTQRIAYCVTPEHKMFGRTSAFSDMRNKDKSDFKFLLIKDIVDKKINFYAPRCADWEDVGELTDFYDIGIRKFERGAYLNRNRQGRKSSIFPIVPFLKVLGWFISEGDFSSPGKKNRQRFVLGITQTKQEGRKQFKKDTEGFPYVIGEHQAGFTICGKDLFCYLLENVGHYCDQRRIPRDILNLHPSLLRYLFDALVAGDGSISKKTGMIRYLTTSCQLAEDVFELAIKLGYTPTLKKRKNGSKRKLIWEVGITNAYAHCDGTIQNVEEVHYKGKVYCIEVPPHHTILTRYNNKVMWIGQSYLGIRAADKAFWEETLMPKTHYLEDHLWAKFFSNIGQRRGKGKIWGEFDLATVGSLQVNYDDKIVTAGRMFTMGWPI